jgi:hypothetical protein
LKKYPPKLVAKAPTLISTNPLLLIFLLNSLLKKSSLVLAKIMEKKMSWSVSTEESMDILNDFENYHLR